MSDNEPKPDLLSEGEIALLDGIKSIIDVILNAGVAPPAAFERSLVHQRDGYLRGFGAVAIIWRTVASRRRAASSSLYCSASAPRF